MVEVYGPDGLPLASLAPATAAPAPRVDQEAIFGIRNLLGVSSRNSPALASARGLPRGPPPTGPSPRFGGSGSGWGPAYEQAGAPASADAPVIARARRSSGVSAMVSGRVPGADAVCRVNAYQLPLEYGQNSFSIRVTTASGLDHVRARVVAFKRAWE
jgi:hypothetical protein